MHGWTSRQRNAAIASFLSWTLDAFDFFLLVFLLSDIAHSFHVDLEEVTLAILLTLAVRPVGALIFRQGGGEVWSQTNPDAQHCVLLGF
ncbi:metabolite transport protein [Klebsiella pneumoniae]|nr:metabolite transport protein [Klebsiella pneumoniae]